MKWKRATLRDLHGMIRVKGGSTRVVGEKLNVLKLMEYVDRQVGY